MRELQIQMQGGVNTRQKIMKGVPGCFLLLLSFCFFKLFFVCVYVYVYVCIYMFMSDIFVVVLCLYH